MNEGKKGRNTNKGCSRPIRGKERRKERNEGKEVKGNMKERLRKERK